MSKKIVNVIPLTYVPRPHSSIFSYETSMDLAEGSLVSVPFGKKTFPGIVTGYQDKNAPVPLYLKSILSIISAKPVLPPYTIKLIEWMSKYYITSLGLIFKNALTGLNLKELGEHISKIPINTRYLPSAAKNEKKYALGPSRFKKYNKYINITLKNKQNVLLLVPTNKQQANLFEKLNITNKKRAVLLSSNAKKQREQWFNLYTSEGTVLIGTKKIIFAPLNNIGLIIIEDENNTLYKTTLQHPKYDARETVEMLAQLISCPIIFGGYVPSLRSFMLLREQERLPRIPKNKKININIENLNDKNLRAHNYRFSPRFLEIIENELDKDEKIIILSARKGAASGLICRDCGETIKCPLCSAPLPLYVFEGKNRQLICRHCGKIIEVPKTCLSCNGWRFRTLGLASNKIAEYLKGFFEDAKIFIFDSSTVKTDKDRNRIINEFNNTKRGILIATTMVLDETLNPVNLAALPALDQFLAIPNYQAQESLFDIIIKLKKYIKPNGNLLLQTYHPEQKFLEYIKANNINGFLGEELLLRKELSWPPFTKLIKITYKHRVEDKARGELLNLLKNLEGLKKKSAPEIEFMGPYPAFIRKISGSFYWHILIKEHLNNKNLSTELQEKLYPLIPSNFEVITNPESIL